MALFYRTSYYFKRPHRFVEELYLRTKWFFQRGWRGYSDSDCWSLDVYLSSWLPKALVRLRDSRHSGDSIDTLNLQGMIDGFEAINTMENSETINLGSPEWLELERKRDKGLALFAKHFQSLWD